MAKASVFNQIRQVVSSVPVGKVTTYGAISRKLGLKSARVVGWALKDNEDMSIPCHRVVRSDGTLAQNFSLGGWPEQRRRLTSEGISFSGRQIQHFSQCLIDLTQSSTSI